LRYSERASREKNDTLLHIVGVRNLDAASIRGSARNLAQRLVVDKVVDTSKTLGKAARRQDFSEDG
jgi:hypothetical protein